MSAFDSINTALSTAGTGGFGFRNDSFASATPAQQIIVTVFMLIFSVNFNSYYLVLKCKLRDAFNTEVRFFFTVVIAVSAIITFNLFTSMEHITSIGDAIRKAAFTVASLISTTGFTVDNFNLWPSLSQTLLILIMFIGGCAGSTAGGIKCSRVVILIKGMLRELRRIIHPRQVKKITLDSKPVDHEVVRSVNAYIVTLLVLFVGSLVIVSFDNYDLTTSFTSVVATINNVGPGLGAAYSNFADFSILSKLVFVFDMLAGRLELFPMLILFSPFTYRKS
jgi:trk system potassium uptake protein TrkH